ncbi:MAG: hypothetical protein ABIL09_27735 [Gemmatimonadota bacterium]
MVLDIRHLWAGGENDPPPPEESPTQHVIEVAAGPEAAGPVPPTDLGALLSRATEVARAEERAAAVAQLRSLVPSPDGVALLATILDSPGDPRRLVAAQVLGHHRQWLSQKSGVERLLGWARAERDPEVGASLVWGLRNRDAIQEFLLHPIAGMAREAALGVPVNERTADAVIHTLVVGRSPEVDRILADKLREVRPGLVAPAVPILLSWMGQAGGEEIRGVLASLPQVPLFRIFVEGEGVPHWRPEQTAEDSERARTWHQLGRLVEDSLRSRPGPDLVRHLVSRTAGDETFARRHVTYLEAAGRTQAVFSAELLADLERLTATATADKLARLAELLVKLAGRLQGQSALQVEGILEQWKARSPELKLRIYHLQQGLK